MLKSPNESTSTTDATTQQAEPEAAKPENGNVFSSIRDAVTKQIGLKCEYSDEDGQVVQTYIKGNKVYMEGETDLGDKKALFKGIIRDEKYYFWNAESKEGMMITLNEPEENDDLSMGETKITSQEDVIRELEKNKDKCSTANIQESMFDLPKDVTFTEFSW